MTVASIQQVDKPFRQEFTAVTPLYLRGNPSSQSCWRLILIDCSFVKSSEIHPVWTPYGAFTKYESIVAKPSIRWVLCF